MKTQVFTAPTLEPITLSELKEHLRLSSETFGGNIDTTVSFAHGSHVIANNYTTHVGTGVDVLGYNAIVNLVSGTNGATGTVDTKIQESDDNVTYTDWTGGAFTQVTEANDNAVQEKAYTGTKRYIRTVSKVLLAACEFGTEVIRQASTLSEDSLLTAIITTAREHVENITRRALLTQTIYAYLDEWPDKDYIELPFGNLQSVTSLSWKDTAGTETTLTATTDYLVETNSDMPGRIVLPYGVSWPSGVLYPSNPIKIIYICGWTAAASIPKAIIAAIKMICADLYEMRGEPVIGQTVIENKTVDRLLASYRLWGEL